MINPGIENLVDMVGELLTMIYNYYCE